jgi:hypothetical protein
LANDMEKINDPILAGFKKLLVSKKENIKG